jgi:hypothetical protein
MCISKQIFSVLTILFFLNPAIKAQNLSDTINNKLLKQAVKTEIIDASGNLHSGSLVYADSSSIFLLSDKEKEAELLKIQADQIIKIHLKEKQIYGKRLGNAMALTAGIAAIIVAYVYATNTEVSMIGPGGALVMVQSAYGAPTAFAIATATIPRTNIKYITEGKASEYHKVVPYISQNGVLSQEPDSATELQIKPNDQALRDLQKPIIDKSPQSSLPFHLNISSGLSYLDFSQQITEAPNYGFTDKFKHIRSEVNLSMKLSFNLTNKIRPFICFPGKNSFTVEQNNSSGHEMVFWYDSHQLAVGADYHFKTVNRMFRSHFEYSAGMGLAGNLLKFNTWYAYNMEEYSTLNKLEHELYGLYFNAAAGYYIAPHVSIDAGVSSSIFMEDTFQNLNYEFTDSDDIIINSLNTGTFHLALNLGITIHI